MNKSELLTALSSYGVTAPEGATNAELKALLDEATKKAGEAASGSPVGTGEQAPPVSTGGETAVANEAPAGAPADSPPAAPPERQKPVAVFMPPSPPRMVYARVIGQAICEEGVHYTKGDVFKLPLERAYALGPGLIEEAEEPDDEDDA